MHPNTSLRAGARACLAPTLLWLLLAARLLAQSTGTIEGRVTNPSAERQRVPAPVAGDGDAQRV